MNHKNHSSISIGEVSRLTGVPAHTLRYWEREFYGILSPKRTRGGQRIYGEREIGIILSIKGLLREQGYSINGARRVMERGDSGPIQKLEYDREFIERIADVLIDLISEKLKTSRRVRQLADAQK